MSHFTVGVITKKDPATAEGREELDGLLRPFNEQTEEKEFLEFEEDSDADIDEETGKPGYWTNPNAKWDWYNIGGRWSGLLTTMVIGADGVSLEPKKVDMARIRDVDRSMDKEAYKQAKRFWEVVVEGSPLKDDETKDQFFNMYKQSYYFEHYGSKEAYAKEQASFSLFALLTSDGDWLEQGEMGWFGMSSTTKESKETFISKLETTLDERPNHYLTVVDCHI